MKILHCPAHSAGIPITLARVQTQLGVVSHSMLKGESWHEYGPTFDLGLNPRQPKWSRFLHMMKFAIKATYDYDVFQFYYNDSLIFDGTPVMKHWDLPVLGRLGKTIVFCFGGCDGYMTEVALQKYKYSRCQGCLESGERACPTDEWKKAGIRRAQKYGSAVICTDAGVYEFVVQEIPDCLFVPQPLDLDLWQPVPFQEKTVESGTLKVVHAPSRPGFKGTRYVLAAVDQLKNEGLNFDFELITHMPNAQAKRRYMEADIIIDQVLAGYYGVLAVEGMALGKPVLSSLSSSLFPLVPHLARCPIVEANPDTLVDQLRMVLQDADRRKHIGQQGRAYVEQYHDARKIGQMLIELYHRVGPTRSR